MPATKRSTAKPSFRLLEGGGLEGRRGRGKWTQLTPRPVFPLSEPSSMISLRDSEGEEWAFVEDPGELEKDSAKALGQAVGSSRFLIEITAVHSVELQHELRLWKVETRQGPRTFPAHLDHWPRALGRAAENGWLITDVTGDVYRIPPLAELDEDSGKVLWSFIG